MSETSNVTTPVAPKKTPPDLSKVELFTVNRNNIDKPLTAFAGTRGNWDGVVYQAPQVLETPGAVIKDDTILLNDLEWVGKQNVIDFLNTILKRTAQDCWRDSIPDAETPMGFDESQYGIFQQNLFLDKITKLSAAQMRISELNDLYNQSVQALKDAQDQFMKDIFAASTITNEDERKAKMAEVGEAYKKLGEKVASYKAQLDERKSRKSKEEQTETVMPE